MTTMTLEQPIELIEQGKNLQAQAILIDILATDPHNLPAWYWYVKAHQYAEERIETLKLCLKHNPHNAQVKLTLDKLQATVKDLEITPMPSSLDIVLSVLYIIALAFFAFQFKSVIVDIPWTQLHGLEGLFFFYAMVVGLVWCGFNLLSSIIMVARKKQNQVKTVIVACGILAGSIGMAFSVFIIFDEFTRYWSVFDIGYRLLWVPFGFSAGVGLATLGIFVSDAIKFVIGQLRQAQEQNLL